jgi:hypothetical protein
MQLAVGLIPAFIVAGVFEGFVTPTDVIPEALKVALGIAAAMVFWLYLLVGGMSRKDICVAGAGPSKQSSSAPLA